MVVLMVGFVSWCDSVGGGSLGVLWWCLVWFWLVVVVVVDVGGSGYRFIGWSQGVGGRAMVVVHREAVGMGLLVFVGRGCGCGSSQWLFTLHRERKREKKIEEK